jgi:predicted MPP superfamily phosphohydrolase
MLLQKTIPQNRISFIVLGDSHLISRGKNANHQHILNKNGNLYKRILNNIVSLTLAGNINPLFILHGGDAVDAGSAENFDAFVKLSKGVLEKAGIPIFVSLGNHDYHLADLSTSNFEQYIGATRESFLIPHTSVKIIRLNTHYSGIRDGENYYGYFAKDDIALLPKGDLKYHYLLDFHIPLRVCDFYNAADNYHILSTTQTHKFLSNINPNVCGIFCHHRHTHYSCAIKYHYKNQTYPLPFITSGCAGNPTCRYPHFYNVTLDLRNYSLTSVLHHVS